jgi:hypothetical protein
MKKHVFIIISIFLLAANANVASGYNNVLHETNNIEFGLQSSVYSNNGILDYSPELARIGIELVHMGHRKFLTNSATQNGITYLSWIAPIGKGVTLLSNIIRTGAKLITKQAVKEGMQAIEVGKYTITKTVANKLAHRPYINSPSTITNIMKSGKGIPDATFKGGMNWKVQGSFNGLNGIYELGINPQTNTIYHFLFRTVK